MFIFRVVPLVISIINCPVFEMLDLCWTFEFSHTLANRCCDIQQRLAKQDKVDEEFLHSLLYNIFNDFIIFIFGFYMPTLLCVLICLLCHLISKREPHFTNLPVVSVPYLLCIHYKTLLSPNVFMYRLTYCMILSRNYVYCVLSRNNDIVKTCLQNISEETVFIKRL